MKPAPPVVLAGAARHAIEARATDSRDSEWEQANTFTVWTWNGAQLHARSTTLIDPSLNAERYPDLITRIADRDHAENDDPAYAYQLTFEGWGVVAPGEDASEMERVLHKLDRATRSYHDRIDRIEFAIAHLADVHGRLFTATTERRNRGRITELRYAPGRHPDGRVTQALLDAAGVTGHLGYGYPVSPAARLEPHRG